jgi:hypothetical protein
MYPSIYERLAGVNAASAEDSSLYDAYTIRYQSAYSQLDVGYENYYDAAYYLLYATGAAGSLASISGSDIARGMQRLLSGRLEFGVGPDDLPSALSALSTPNATITLNGTMGPPTWDPATGGRTDPGSVWCVDSSGTQRADVLRYDTTNHSLVGTFPCITGF